MISNSEYDPAGFIYKVESVVYNCTLHIHYDPNVPNILVQVYYPRSNQPIPLIFTPPELSLPTEWPDIATKMFADFLVHYAAEQLLSYRAAGCKVH